MRGSVAAVTPTLRSIVLLDEQSVLLLLLHGGFRSGCCAAAQFRVHVCVP